MKLQIEGQALDPGEFIIKVESGRVESYLLPVLAFLKFWLSDLEYFESKTSGSTSTPKVIRISRQQIEASANLTINRFALDPKKDGLVLCLSAEHVGGFMVLARGLIGNLDVQILNPTSDPKSFTGLSSHRNWFISMVPLQFHFLLQHPDVKKITGNWKGILLGGAPFVAEDLPFLNRISCPVYHSYGMTETVSHIAVRKIYPNEKIEIKEIPFQILPGIDVNISQNGCLRILGPVTNNLWVETRDLVEMVDSDSFRFLGRLDQIINSGGLKIDPTSVSELINSLISGLWPEWEVLGLPDPILGEKVVLVFFGQTQSLFSMFWSNLNWEQKTFEIPEKNKRVLLPKEIYYISKKPTTLSQKTDFQKMKILLLTSAPIWKNSRVVRT
jgi:O-succinylbenzoic acid--CoA ligase